MVKIRPPNGRFEKFALELRRFALLACVVQHHRFEEELVAGGNPEAMQRRMNENLASLGLAVRYTPQAEGGRPNRMSQLEVLDTRRTQNDLHGRPFNPTIGFAYDRGMLIQKRA